MYIQFFPSGTFPVPDGEKQHVEASAGLGFGGTLVPSVVADMEFKKRTDDMPCAKKCEALGNGKRPYSGFPAEAPNKRVKQEQAISITSEENTSEEPAWKIAASTHDVNDEILIATDEDYLRRTGFDPLEDDQFLLSDHSYQRRVPIGSDHQADLPDWIPVKFKTFCSQSSFHDTHSAQNICASSPDMDVQVGRSAIDCDCADEGSITCVKQHVMEARENLRRSLGTEMFTELGFSDMGEDVARRWVEMDEDLFHMVVLSNSATLGRNFWTVLPHIFPSRRFRELVSYYFNVFILRKRADQNRFDPLNVDSDNDDWQEEEEEGEEEGEGEEEEEEEEDSAVESHADRNRSTPGADVSEELNFQNEADDDEEDEFYCGKSLPLAQPAEGNSTDCSLDQDAQGDSCTSFERMYNAERDHENSLAEHRKYEYFDPDCDSKPWEINYFQGTDKSFDFFPTCNVLEEVFGKGSWDKGASDGSDFS